MNEMNKVMISHIKETISHLKTISDFAQWEYDIGISAECDKCVEKLEELKKQIEVQNDSI